MRKTTRTYLLVSVSDGEMYWSPGELVSGNARRTFENSQRAFLQPREPQQWDSAAIEATSYALLVFLTREGVTPRAEAAMRWLNSARDWDQAFTGTTVM